MARSTQKKELGELPKGMHPFKVVRSTIRDSQGAYCTVGDMAVLTKEDAEHYLELGHIRAELPDFEEPADDTADNADTTDTTDESAASAETPAAAGEDSGKATGRRRTNR